MVFISVLFLRCYSFVENWFSESVFSVEMEFLINIPFILSQNKKTKSLQIVNFLMGYNCVDTDKIYFLP